VGEETIVTGRNEVSRKLSALAEADWPQNPAEAERNKAVSEKKHRHVNRSISKKWLEGQFPTGKESTGALVCTKSVFWENKKVGGQLKVEIVQKN